MTDEQVELYEGEPLNLEEFESLSKLKSDFHVNLKKAERVSQLRDGVLIQNKHVIGISLPKVQLIEFPPILLNFPFLKELLLSGNNITHIPDWIFNFRFLSYLKIDQNKIEVLDYNHCPLSLEVLVVSNNKIRIINQTNHKLIKLKELNLKGNLLNTVPEMLKDFENLRSLTLDNNPIQTVPIWCKNLIKLEVIRLNNSNLYEFPMVILEIKSLVHLELKGNKLKSFPKELVQGSAIKRVYLEDNEISADFSDFSEEEYDKLSFDATTFYNHVFPNKKLAVISFIKFLNREKLLKFQQDNDYEIDKIDINRWSHIVQFECENVTSRTQNSPYPETVMGLHTVEDHPFLGVSAGGDWEYPVFFILFEKKGELQLHIPKHGNVWNQETNRAFGNDLEADVRYLAKYRQENSMEPIIIDTNGEVLRLGAIRAYLDAMANSEELLMDIALFLKFF